MSSPPHKAKASSATHPPLLDLPPTSSHRLWQAFKVRLLNDFEVTMAQWSELLRGAVLPAVESLVAEREGGTIGRMVSVVGRSAKLAEELTKLDGLSVNGRSAAVRSLMVAEYDSGNAGRWFVDWWGGRCWRLVESVGAEMFEALGDVDAARVRVMGWALKWTWLVDVNGTLSAKDYKKGFASAGPLALAALVPWGHVEELGARGVRKLLGRPGKALTGSCYKQSPRAGAIVRFVNSVVAPLVATVATLWLENEVFRLEMFIKPDGSASGLDGDERRELLQFLAKWVVGPAARLAAGTIIARAASVEEGLAQFDRFCRGLRDSPAASLVMLVKPMAVAGAPLRDDEKLVLSEATTMVGVSKKERFSLQSTEPAKPDLFAAVLPAGCAPWLCSDGPRAMLRKGAPSEPVRQAAALAVVLSHVTRLWSGDQPVKVMTLDEAAVHRLMRIVSPRVQLLTGDEGEWWWYNMESTNANAVIVARKRMQPTQRFRS